MVYEEKYKVGVEDVGKDNHAHNRGILSYLENVACAHAATTGFGLLDIEQKGVVWILLGWNVQVLKRPLYGDTILVRTWPQKIDKLYCIRDFEIVNEDGEQLVKAESKWILMDAQSRKIVKLVEEYVGGYEEEPNRKMLEGDFPKFVEPDNYLFSKDYQVERRDIDMNEHLHNLNYLDIAYEILPEEVYQNCTFDNIWIEYKKEIKYHDQITCHYTCVENKHIVTFKVADKMHAAVVLSA